MPLSVMSVKLNVSRSNAGQLADVRQDFVVHAAPAEIQFPQSGRGVRCAMPSAFHQGSRELQDLELFQSGQLRQTGVGDGRLTEIELLETGQIRQRRETQVADLRDLKIQFFQTGQPG